jgi:hypothetical protein
MGHQGDRRRSAAVRIGLKFITPLIAAGAVAAVMAAAPMAAADSTQAAQTCNQSGPGTQCQSPGNVQLNDDPAPVQFYPYGGESGLLGGGGGRP